MIITTLKRREFPNFWLGGKEPPKVALDALKELDKQLELVWNKSENQWEIYRLKSPGLSPGEDTLYHQMSAPTKGTIIGAGIKTWLQKYDTSGGGLKDKDELVKQWFGEVKERNYRREQKAQKRRNEYYYNQNTILQFLIRDPVSYPRILKPKRPKDAKIQIRIPITVGMNRKTGKPIRMG